MKNIKIAFFDIDGTLIDMQAKEMTALMKKALIQLKENGVILCIATGRPFKNVPHFDGIEFDAFLTFNGSYCCTQDTIIHKEPIAKNDVDKIIKNARTINRPVSLASSTRIAANGTDQNLADYFAIANEAVEIADDFDEFKNDDIYQMMIGCPKEEYDSILQNVSGAKITAWWDRAADIIPASGGKGAAVKKILKYYNLTKENAIAFGDGANDIEMLQTVGLGVAMGNAADNVKEAADDICDTVRNDGIYHYCKKMCLI